mmetsp:Transcript_16051/g.44755  ORF Transcript_16051/g.44755 Transcript_16051/m.44755 type:complete len:270 (-) Transcript_16051:185-994(-)
MSGALCLQAPPPFHEQRGVLVALEISRGGSSLWSLDPKNLPAVTAQGLPPAEYLETEFVRFDALQQHPVHDLNASLDVVHSGADLKHCVVHLHSQWGVVVANHTGQEVGNGAPPRRILFAIAAHQHSECHGVGDENAAKELVKHALCHVHLPIASAGMHQCRPGHGVGLHADACHFCELPHRLLGLVSLAQLLHPPGHLLPHLFYAGGLGGGLLLLGRTAGGLHAQRAAASQAVPPCWCGQGDPAAAATAAPGAWHPACRAPACNVCHV